MGKTVAIVVLAVAAMFSIPISIAVYQDPQVRANLLNTVNISSPAPVAVDDPKLTVGDIERQIHTLINEERTEAGLAPFNWDARLASIARDHSLNMANFNFVSHRDQNSDEPPQRYFDAGYACPFGAPENIYYYGAETEDFAKMAVDSWMNSKDHRQNILTAQLTKEGLGVAVGDHGMYATQNFC